ncbi:MAG: NAD(P)-dependent oxidoreductase [Verrucomicrobiae bacterium]|nr:NAD(P)-dependent oxidoreductase [Verrucomicrobiae bacterium]
MSPAKHVFVLGHSGFIGHTLIRMLGAESHPREVTGLSISDLDFTHPDCVPRLAARLTPDSVVVLCAAVKRQFGDTPEAFRNNLSIVENVIAAVTLQPVRRLIFMSSAAVYGEETDNAAISEQTLPLPSSYYGIAKYTGERLLQRGLSSLSNTSLVCLRPPLVYGPGDRGKCYGPSGFCAAALEHTPITLWGDGTELREFLFVEDMCRIIIHLLDHPFEGILNAAGGQSHSFVEILDLIRSNGYPLLRVDSKPRSKKKVDNVFTGKLIRELMPADFAFTTLPEGVKRTLTPAFP